MTPDEREALEEQYLLLSELQRRKKGRLIDTLYPDDGPLRRDLYPKHLEFFRLGKVHRERAAIAANRVGKTFGIGGYEVALHLTGRYPDWWDGHRFDEPVDVTVAGNTGTTTRDIIQSIMIGPPSQPDRQGEMLIPRDTILSTTRSHGIPNALSEASILHASGGTSTLAFRAYEQGRKIFEGVAKHVVWFDEEPPADVWSEGLTRTMTVKGGMVIGTFTPLMGMTETVLMFLNPEAQEAAS